MTNGIVRLEKSFLKSVNNKYRTKVSAFVIIMITSSPPFVQAFNYKHMEVYKGVDTCMVQHRVYNRALGC